MHTICRYSADYHTSVHQAHVFLYDLWQISLLCFGFTALGKAIGTPNSTDKDCAYVTEHPVLKYLRPKLANFLYDFRRPYWFTRFRLPVSNGRHN